MVDGAIAGDADKGARRIAIYAKLPGLLADRNDRFRSAGGIASSAGSARLATAGPAASS